MSPALLRTESLKRPSRQRLLPMVLLAALPLAAGCGGGGGMETLAPPGQGGPELDPRPGPDPDRMPTGDEIDLANLPALTGVRATAWQPLDLAFSTGAVSPVHGGPPSEGDASPGNPWLDWRLDLRLTRPDGESVLVPGFFAGDGAGEGRGDVWRVRFTPPSIPGVWSGTVVLRRGGGVNLGAPSSTAGSAVFGRTVQIVVEPPATSAPGFFGKGPVQAGSDGRLRHADRSLFVKAGVGSPENFLGYEGFDGAIDGLDGGPPGESGGAPNFLHAFDTHRADWNPGDPDWGGGRGRGIIGALNYLASVGANAIYVMPMNLGGDGRDTFPFLSNSGGARFPVDADDARSFAVRRLAQWDMVLRHAQARGILVQFVLAEREPTNIGWLGGATSTLRLLYLKQLVAHFGYLPGVEWTLCEENAAPGASTFAQFTPVELRQQADWIRGWDPSGHPRSVHVDPNDLSLYTSMINQGAAGWLDCVSLQVHGDQSFSGGLYGGLSEEIAGRFAAIGRRVVVHMDEPGFFQTGVGSELHPGAWAQSPFAGPEDRRRRVLYDSLFSGAGILWYFGLYSEAEGGGDLTTEDFRTRESTLLATTIARRAIESTFQNAGLFGPADALWESEASPLHPVYGDAEVIAEAAGPALVYLPALGPSASVPPGTLGPLRLGAPGVSLYRATWISPRTGLQQGGAQTFDPTQPFRPNPPAGAPLDPDVDWLLRVVPE